MTVLNATGVRRQATLAPEPLLEHEPPPASASAVDVLTRDFLAWIAGAPRTYAEAMDAWRTSCPRLPIWENAVEGDLIRIENKPGQRMGQAAVVITERGQRLLSEPR